IVGSAFSPGNIPRHVCCNRINRDRGPIALLAGSIPRSHPETVSCEIRGENGHSRNSRNNGKQTSWFLCSEARNSIAKECRRQESWPILKNQYFLRTRCKQFSPAQPCLLWPRRRMLLQRLRRQSGCVRSRA